MTKSDDLVGIALMTLGMAAYAAADALIKVTSGFVESSQIILVIGLGGFIMFCIAALSRGERLLTPMALSGAVTIRNIGEVMAAVGIVTALQHVPLSLVTTIMQCVPLLVAAGSCIFLREHISLKEWAAIVLGFVGMLVILRPGNVAFEPYTLVAVLSALGLAIRDLASRAVPKGTSSIQISVWACAVLGLVGLAMSAFSNSGGLNTSLFPSLILLLMIILTGLGMFCITAAMRTGSVGVVSPFRYSRLLFGLFFGVVFFGEVLDAYTVFGGALIVICGLYTLSQQIKKIQT
ncbi:MAG: DMT family transporter [Hyphomicrobiales bacterium]